MNADWFLIFTLITVVSSDFYNSKYNCFNVQPLLENDRILLSYTKCFLDQGPCTPDAKDFNKVIPEALETTCGKCSPKQKLVIKTVIKAVISRHPDAWDQLTEKYDKDKKYKDSFDKFLA
uniref:CSP3 n=1 Tax=Helicoverpa armigera TaxID=29058 RepID=H6TDX8_HELAM|nr:CSP3 [Helicoverpa armigera]